MDQGPKVTSRGCNIRREEHPGELGDVGREKFKVPSAITNMSCPFRSSITVSDLTTMNLFIVRVTYKCL